MGLEDEDPVTIMVARLDPIKDPQLFIAMARRVRRNLPRARFWLVGGGTLEKELARDLAANPDPGIWLAGEREDVPDLLAAADVGILTSKSEGLSNTILEAMSCGLPMLATDVGGNGELIEEGRNGHLLGKRDAESIARKVEEVLCSDGKGEAMGRAGRLLVEKRYSLVRLAENATAHYERLIRN